jgi:hypothetical protein
MYINVTAGVVILFQFLYEGMLEGMTDASMFHFRFHYTEVILDLNLSGFGFLRGTEYLYPTFFQLFKKYFEMTLARRFLEKVHLFKKCFIKLIIN